MRDNALCFPNVNVHYDAWFARLLLYWDSVATIVPEDHLTNPANLDSDTRDLVEAGAVNQVVPLAYHAEIADLTEPFLAYVGENLKKPRAQRSSRLLADRSRKTLLHMEKMHFVSDELVKLGLARIERHPWYEVETWAADAFMFFLASKLGELEDVDAVPVTNALGAQRVLFDAVVDHRTAYTKRVATAQQRIIDALLPAPVRAPDVWQVLEFKERYGHLLQGLRREVETASIDLAVIEDPSYRDERFLAFIGKFEEGVNEISDAMRSRWKDVAFGRLLPILPPAIILTSLATGNLQLSAVAASGSLLAAVIAASRGGPRSRGRVDNPLAYVAYAQRTFGYKWRSQ